MSYNFPYRWYKTDLEKVEPCGLKVFSCFSGGGGSSFGYELNGCDVIGNCEIDSNMQANYLANHNPKYSNECSIVDLVASDSLPDELYNLDILDGSPPCSAFSIMGLREKVWGKKRKFVEGQTAQVLDELFFHFINFADKLQPKVIIAENVPGMIIGNAKKYAGRVLQGLSNIGYASKYFTLNGSRMGLPQKRKRVFFIATRRDLFPFTPIVDTPKISFNFKEPEIPFSEFREGGLPEIKKGRLYDKWLNTIPGKGLPTNNPNRKEHACARVSKDKPLPTISGGVAHFDHDVYRYLSDNELLLGSSFPLDYEFVAKTPQYVCGMSVPPIMMANVVKVVKEKIFKLS